MVEQPPVTVCESALRDPNSEHPPASQKPYMHIPLCLSSRHEVRLLDLWPGRPEDPILCDIRHASLQDDPEYEALSYTWATQEGDGSLSQTITCCGQVLNVSRTCEAALRKLRRHGLKRTLWVDMICIDQQNIAERNHQVELMDEIYSSAARVLVVLETIDTLTEWQSPSIINWLTGVEFKTPTHHELSTFFSLRWFNRIWVVQEVALARSVEVHVDQMRFSLSATVHKRLEELCSGLRLQVPGPLRWQPDIYRRLERNSVEKQLLACLSAVRGCSSTDPRDKVFAILSLLDHSIRSLMPVDYSKSFPEVSIQAAVASIKTSGTLEILSHIGASTRYYPQDGTMSVEWIHAVGTHIHPEDCLPSWVPDWTSERDSFCGQFLTAQDSLIANSTSEAKPERSREVNSSRILAVNGQSWKRNIKTIITDRVNKRTKVTINVTKASGATITYRDDMFSSPSSSKVYILYHPGNRTESTSRTLPPEPTLRLTAHFLGIIRETREDCTRAGGFPSLRHAIDLLNVRELAWLFPHFTPLPTVPDRGLSYQQSSADLENKLAWFTHLQTSICDCLLCNSTTDETPTSSSRHGATDEIWPFRSWDAGPLLSNTADGRHLFAFLNDANRWGEGKRFFETMNGVGFARKHSWAGFREGDVVVALDGANTPFILRKCREEGKYTIVSSCYLCAPSVLDSWANPKNNEGRNGHQARSVVGRQRRRSSRYIEFHKGIIPRHFHTFRASHV
jgi:hypothetical protein